MNNSCLAPHSWLYGRVTRTAQRRKHIHINWEQCAKHFFFFFLLSKKGHTWMEIKVKKMINICISKVLFTMTQKRRSHKKYIFLIIWQVCQCCFFWLGKFPIARKVWRAEQTSSYSEFKDFLYESLSYNTWSFKNQKTLTTRCLASGTLHGPGSRAVPR